MNDLLRRRTVRTLIKRCGLEPVEAGKEYRRKQKRYDWAADYCWPSSNWEEAQDLIVRVYHT